MAAVLKYLVPAMTFYFPMFASRFGTDEQSVGMAMNEYAERLEHHGVNGIQFKAGIAALKSDAGQSDYYPNPERFALLCKSTASDGLPTYEQALSEIIQRRGPERHSAEFQFSHELIRLINQRKGGMIYEQTGMQFEKTIKAEYEHWCKRIAGGEQLPAPLSCISDQSKPDLPDYLKNPAEPKSALAKLAAKRAQGEV